MPRYPQGLPRDSIELALREVFAAPEYQWDSPKGRLKWLWDSFDRVVSALLSLRESHPAAYYAVIALLVAVLLLVLAHLAYVVWRIVRPYVGSNDLGATRIADARGPDWYIDQARRASENGLFHEALGLRFRALLLRLDRSGTVAFHPSKTPAEYLSEARLGEAARRMLTRLVATLYGHLFGGVACTERDLLDFDRNASLLENRGVSA